MILHDHIGTVEIECADIGPYIAEVKVWGRETDDSFSHEFGIEERKGIEPTDAEILSVMDDDGGDIELIPDDEETILMWAKEKFVEQYCKGNL